jgi:hypothetical protein
MDVEQLWKCELERHVPIIRPEPVHWTDEVHKESKCAGHPMAPHLLSEDTSKVTCKTCKAIIASREKKQVLHYAGFGKEGACGRARHVIAESRYPQLVNGTMDPEKVTCKGCLKSKRFQKLNNSQRNAK